MCLWVGVLELQSIGKHSCTQTHSKNKLFNFICVLTLIFSHCTHVQYHICEENPYIFRSQKLNSHTDMQKSLQIVYDTLWLYSGWQVSKVWNKMTMMIWWHAVHMYSISLSRTPKNVSKCNCTLKWASDFVCYNT